MATKKASSRKTTKATTARKKTVTKKAPVRKSPVRRAASVSRQDRNFLDWRFTLESIVWVIIGIAVIATAIIVMNMSQQLNDIYDQIDAQNASLDT
jgi:hypothetical protein